MPSDERVTLALTALRAPIAQYRFAVSSALERAAAVLASEAEPANAGVTLGAFASGRIDPERFAMISAGAAPLDVVSCSVLRRAIETLEQLLASGDDAFIVSVPFGTSAAGAIGSKLARLGAAFAVASTVELVRRRTYDPNVHGLPFEEHPFEKWTTGERRQMPPLVVRLAGADLDPFQLAKYVDGFARIVLLVEQPCAPAPLARLMSPGVFVAQSDDMAIISKPENLEGPAVIGIMNGGEARFTHDPMSGSAMWQRIQVSRMPEILPRKSLGGRSAAQQREDVALLGSMAEQPVFPINSADALVAAIGAGTGNADPVDRLADWVLSQSMAPGPA